MFLLAIVFFFIGEIQGKCNVLVTHYEEIGCKPFYSNPDNECPAYYDCSKFFSRSSNKCYYMEKEYNIGDELNENDTESDCAASCYCNADSDWIDINCANIECPEMVGFIPSTPNCFWRYDINSCCSTGEVCPPFDNLASCEVEGKTYYDGQEFFWPGEDSLKCVCQPNFTGKAEEPFCIRVKCGVELRDSANIRNKCAPVYYGYSGYCPIHFQCQEDADFVVSNDSSNKTGKKCSYGNLDLYVGDKIVRNGTSDINCECATPPLVTCVQTPYDYNN